MAKKDVLATLRGLCLPVVEGLGYALYDLEYVKEGRDWFVRIFIDRVDGGSVTIDDCETVSRKVEALLDERDPVEQGYILEVCSPGLDRVLKTQAHFDAFKGSVVDVKLYKPRDKRKEFQGTLLGLAEGVVTIEEDGSVITFNSNEIAVCRLAVFF